MKAMPADQVVEYVLSNAGARPWDRDEIDKRIIQTVRDRTGAILDSQNQVGGYPPHEKTTRAID